MVDLSVFSRVDYWSLAAVPVEVDREGFPLGHGTAFFYVFGAQTFLVTAWHVLSGRHSQTDKAFPKPALGRLISQYGGIQKEGQVATSRHNTSLSLYDPVGDRRWIELRHGNGWIDVAILPVEVPAGAEAYPVNELPTGSMQHGMGGDLFILGFPLHDQPLKLPIWKRASLASEPEIPEALQPYWLVDTASRSGMSGAPVIRRAYSYGLTQEDFINEFNNPGHRGVSSFEGVYSGRLKGLCQEDAQLGFVWPIWWLMRLIKECIGEAAYQAGLASEFERAQRVLRHFNWALEHGGRAKREP